MMCGYILEKDEILYIPGLELQWSPIFWAAGPGSMERGFYVDRRGCGFVSCLNPTDGVSLTCVAQFLVCRGPVTIHEPGVGDPCHIVLCLKGEQGTGLDNIGSALE